MHYVFCIRLDTSGLYGNFLFLAMFRNKNKHCPLHSERFGIFDVGGLVLFFTEEPFYNLFISPCHRKKKSLKDFTCHSAPQCSNEETFLHHLRKGSWVHIPSFMSSKSCIIFYTYILKNILKQIKKIFNEILSHWELLQYSISELLHEGGHFGYSSQRPTFAYRASTDNQPEDRASTDNQPEDRAFTDNQPEDRNVRLHTTGFSGKYWWWWHRRLKNSCSKYDTKGIIGLSKRNMSYAW